jgi:ribonuclease P/MRP protein subunit POP5
MVRFKNRNLLVEFLTPSALSPTDAISPDTQTASSSVSRPAALADDKGDNGIHEDDWDEDEEDLAPLPRIPFMLPLHGESSPYLNLGNEGGGVIYKALRGVIMDVFGDEGWGRVASSFKGESGFRDL